MNFKITSILIIFAVLLSGTFVFNSVYAEETFSKNFEMVDASDLRTIELRLNGVASQFGSNGLKYSMTVHQNGFIYETDLLRTIINLKFGYDPTVLEYYDWESTGLSWCVNFAYYPQVPGIVSVECYFVPNHSGDPTFDLFFNIIDNSEIQSIQTSANICLDINEYAPAKPDGDECRYVWNALSGIADYDADFTWNKYDNCPYFTFIGNNGCPPISDVYPDSDGDGIPDIGDLCPTSTPERTYHYLSCGEPLTFDTTTSRFGGLTVTKADYPFAEFYTQIEVDVKVEVAKYIYMTQHGKVLRFDAVTGDPAGLPHDVTDPIILNYDKVKSLNYQFTGIDISDTCNVNSMYLSNTNTNKVEIHVIYDENSELGAQRMLPDEAVGAPSDILNQPMGLAMSSTGTLYVANFGGNSVSIFECNSDGVDVHTPAFEYVGELTAPNLLQPYHVAIDPSDDTVLVVDWNNNVYEFDPSGNSSFQHNDQRIGGTIYLKADTPIMSHKQTGIGVYSSDDLSYTPRQTNEPNFKWYTDLAIDFEGETLYALTESGTQIRTYKPNENSADNQQKPLWSEYERPEVNLNSFIDYGNRFEIQTQTKYIPNYYSNTVPPIYWRIQQSMPQEISTIFGIIVEPTVIPSWIKQTAGWWADGSIDDDAFIGALQYLIKEKIIILPETDVNSAKSETIPSWIKQTAGWWADGSIDDDVFIGGLQWMIQNGIISISAPEKGLIVLK